MKLLIISITVIWFQSLYAALPEWVSAPDTLCSPISELCAVGEGTGIIIAEATGRKSLAQTFETQVKAKSVVTTSTKDTLNIKVEENYSSYLEETTSEMLNAVTVKQRYQSKDAVYALVSLDKKKAAKLVGARLKSMDEELKNLVAKDKRGTLAKAIKLLKVRDEIHWRYEYLSGVAIKPPVSDEKIYARIRELSKNQKTLMISFNGGKENEEIPSLVIALFLDLDYRVVTNKNQKGDAEIETTITQEKRYFNVEGFEKYNFVINIEAKEASGKKLGAITFSNEQIGRSLTHAYANALPDIKEYLVKHIDELNIE